MIGAKGKFFARTIDTMVTLSTDIYVEAERHRGTSVVEVLQNCVIFNEGVHDDVAGRDVRADHTIVLKHGKPMIFGKENDKGLILDGLKIRVVRLGEDNITEKDLLVHDATEPNPGIHYMLSNMKYPDYPVALGVIRSVEGRTYDAGVEEQIADIQKKSRIKCMDDLLMSGSTWKIK